MRVKDLQKSNQNISNIYYYSDFSARVEMNHEMFWVCFTSLCDRLKNSRHLFNQSDARELETNRVFAKCVFPRWALVTCICVDECSLVCYVAYTTQLSQSLTINLFFICYKTSCTETLYNLNCIVSFCSCIKTSSWCQ